MPMFKCIFGNTATSGMSSALSSGFWMAEGVFRYYAIPDESGVVFGFMVVFEDWTKKRVDEPLVIAGRIQYEVGKGQEVAGVCQHWDIWYLFFDKNEERDLGTVINFQDPYPGRIKYASLVAAPLYSFESVEEVRQLLSLVGGEVQGATTQANP
jgi:hypothetical protein